MVYGDDAEYAACIGTLRALSQRFNGSPQMARD